MATILKNKKSTTGSPYVYYTVDATPSNRTTTSIDISIKITSKLASSSSTLGATYDLTCYLKFNGTNYSFKIKDNESWSGTTNHTYNRTITVNNLEPSATSITGIKFWARGYNDSSDRAGYTTTTNCSNLTIPIGHTAPSDVYYTMEETVQSVLDAGIPHDTIVANLSRKKFTIGATFYDGAIPARYEVYNPIRFSFKDNPNNPDEVIYPFDEKTIRMDTYRNTNTEIPIGVRVWDNLDTFAWNDNISDFENFNLYSFLVYEKLFFNETNTTIKRRGQTTGNVRVNLNGQMFRGVLGNKDQSGTYKPTIQYKFWKKNEDEPETYDYTIPSDSIEVNTEYIKATTYDPEALYYEKVGDNYVLFNMSYFIGNNNFEDKEVYTRKSTFKVSDYEIGTDDDTLPNHFNPDFAYNVRFKISDNFTTYVSDIKSISVGVATWTEYRDRVDFKKLTIKGEEIKENNVITASLSASASISGTGGQKVIFNKSVIAGKRLFLSNGNVVIGKGISKVKVSAEIYFSGSLTAGDRVNFNIYKNYDTDNSVQITTSQLVVYKTLGSVSSIPVLIEVEEGDTICLVARNRTSGTGTIYYLGTNLTVEAV